MEWRGREWSGGEGRAGQGRVPDCLGGLSRVGISSRSTRPWNGQPPSSELYAKYLFGAKHTMNTAEGTRLNIPHYSGIGSVDYTRPLIYLSGDHDDSGPVGI